jgi:hypothetical protein
MTPAATTHPLPGCEWRGITVKLMWRPDQMMVPGARRAQGQRSPTLGPESRDVVMYPLRPSRPCEALRVAVRDGIVTLTEPGDWQVGRPTS